MGYKIIVGCIIVFAIVGFIMGYLNYEDIKDLQKENDKLTEKLDDYIQLIVETNEYNIGIFNKFENEINSLKTNKLSKEYLSLAIEAIVKMYMEDTDGE